MIVKICIFKSYLGVSSILISECGFIIIIIEYGYIRNELVIWFVGFFGFGEIRIKIGGVIFLFF